MQQSFLDHLVVTAPTLEAGAAWVEQVLGVAPQPGGRHPQMGTHNRLLPLGEDRYLEVMTVDPSAAAPGRPRWFGLDELAPDALPRLSTWVARTTDIRAASAAASESLGAVEAMRRGDLRWLLTIPDSGVVPLDGVAPALIEWHVDAHPAAGLVDVGLRLAGLELHHPQPERVERLLASLALQAPVTVLDAASPHLRARIDTPHGERTLTGALLPRG